MTAASVTMPTSQSALFRLIVGIAFELPDAVN